MTRSKSEIIRSLRLGDLQKILRSRYGHTLPDDDAGREDLFELLLPISLGPEGGRRMKNAIEVWAPWMNALDAGQLIGQINRTPIHSRKPKSRELGERLRVSYQERESLKLKTIKAFDMTDAQMREQRRAKDRARKRRLRQRRPRTNYLVDNSLSRKKPWKTEGISRATWFRRKKLNGETGVSAKQESHHETETGVSAMKYLLLRTQKSLTEKSERPKERASRSSRQRERTERGAGSHPARVLRRHTSLTGAAGYIERWANEDIVEDPAATTRLSDLTVSCRAHAKRHANGATPPMLLEQDLIKVFTAKGCGSHKSRLGVVVHGIRLKETNQ